MKYVLLIPILAATTGCAGTMLDGRFCTLATDEDAQKDIQIIVEKAAGDMDKEKVELALRAARLGSTALCEGARAVGRPAIVEQNPTKE